MRRSKAVSKKHGCDKWKKPLDGNPYIQIDIDRLIDFIEAKIEMIDRLMYAEKEQDLKFLFEIEKNTYESLLGMIRANSFI